MLDLTKLEGELDKALEEDDFEWFKTKRKMETNNLKWYYNPENLYCAMARDESSPGFHRTLEGWRWEDYITYRGYIKEESGWQEANLEEVRTMLLDEAKRRYPEGTKFWPLDGNNESYKSAMPIYSDGVFGTNDAMTAVSANYELVFIRGVWAEVATPESILKAEIEPLWMLDSDNDIRPFNQLTEELPLREWVCFYRTEKEAKEAAYNRRLESLTKELKLEYGID